MFFVALTVVLLVFFALVAQPERWPEKCANFLREHNINHG
jgi:hypothetical protein